MQDVISNNSLMMQMTRERIARRIEAERTNPLLLAQRVGLEPDPWQADLLRSASRQMILLCSRQAGKSTVSSLLALHTALYQENSLILVLSPSLRQSQELFRKIKDAYGQLNAPPTMARQESALTMSFENNSRIVALPGTEQTVRGFSGVSLLIVDEASRVEDALYQAIRPMLAVSKGRIVLLSTPFGKRGFFFHEWTESDATWQRVKITADQVPRIDKDWLERERTMIGDWWFKQEYFCEFVETDDQVFSFDDIAASLSGEIKPLFGAK